VWLQKKKSLKGNLWVQNKPSVKIVGAAAAHIQLKSDQTAQ
jgi:hypothetical protein